MPFASIEERIDVVKAFRTRLWDTAREWPGEERLTSATSGVLDPSKLAEGVLGEVDFAQAFAYLFRRFGPPNAGSDGYKEICQYILVTPHPKLWLTVMIRPSGGMFGYVMPEAFSWAVHEEYRASLEAWHAAFKTWRLERGIPLPGDDASAVRDWGSYSESFERVEAQYVAEGHSSVAEAARSGSLRQELDTALRSALEDLKSPVGVRDSNFSLTEREIERKPVSYSKWAGHSLAPALRRDPDAVRRLTLALSAHGRGCLERGIRRIIRTAPKCDVSDAQG